jgi:diadenosine tetraphosphate (Ap4A) HIT family hydrolase
MQATQSPCALCESEGGELIYRHAKFRVIQANEPLYPGFLRLIWNAHVREFSQLTRPDRLLCMDVLVVLETFVLNTLKADKVNLATLGNVVPHLHWHIIPRFVGDAHFPAPVWAACPEGGQLTPTQRMVFQTQTDWIPQLSLHLRAQFDLM